MVASSPLRIVDCRMSKFYEPMIQVWNYVVYTDIAGFHHDDDECYYLRALCLHKSVRSTCAEMCKD